MDRNKIATWVLTLLVFSTIATSLMNTIVLKSMSDRLDQTEKLLVQNPSFAVWYDFDRDGDGENETWAVRFTYLLGSEEQAEEFVSAYTNSLNRHREDYDEYKKVLDFPQSLDERYDESVCGSVQEYGTGGGAGE